VTYCRFRFALLKVTSANVDFRYGLEIFQPHQRQDVTLRCQNVCSLCSCASKSKLTFFDLSTHTSFAFKPWLERAKPGPKDVFGCDGRRRNPIRSQEMVESREERREAADSVFLFPVVCWLSVMRPPLKAMAPCDRTTDPVAPTGGPGRGRAKA